MTQWESKRPFLIKKYTVMDKSHLTSLFVKSLDNKVVLLDKSYHDCKKKLSKVQVKYCTKVGFHQRQAVLKFNADLLDFLSVVDSI